MRIAIFVHSLRSCWNHGNAHFLRGVAAELLARGHQVTAWEEEGAWSAENLARDHGAAALDAWREAYPGIPVRVYGRGAGGLDLGEALDGGVGLAPALERGRAVVVHQVGGAPGPLLLPGGHLVPARGELGGHAPQEVGVAVVPAGAERVDEERDLHARSSRSAAPSVRYRAR